MKRKTMKRKTINKMFYDYLCLPNIKLFEENDFKRYEDYVLEEFLRNGIEETTNEDCCNYFYLRDYYSKIYFTKNVVEEEDGFVSLSNDEDKTIITDLDEWLNED